VLDVVLAFAAGLLAGFTLGFAWRHRDVRVFYLESRGNTRPENGPPGAADPAPPAPGDTP
jgi:hypothetical protein